MVLKVTRDGVLLNYEYDHFDDVEQKIVFIESKNTGNLIYVNYTLSIDNRFQNKSFEIYYLIKNNLKESDIFQVFYKKLNKRIGWCIPINALDSKDHSYADNEHFLRYAYVGVKAALKNLHSCVFTNTVDISTSDNIRLSDIFHESTSLLIISKETLDETCNFSLQKALPSLFNAGYIELDINNPSLLTLIRSSPINSKISIELMSDDVNSAELITVLLKNVACSQSSAVIQFFYLYQIVELLLECVFKNEYKLLVQNILDCPDDSSEVKEMLDKFQNCTSEKKRISLLMNKYITVNSDIALLKESCNRFLLEIGG